MHRCGDLERAVRRARAAARPGDVVLLSPACTSYDQYPDYEARGAHFRSLVSAGLMANGRRERRPSTPLEHRMLLTVTLCLLAAGAVMVYSASSARDLLAGGGDGTGYLLRYVGYGAVGVVVMHVLSGAGSSPCGATRRCCSSISIGSCSSCSSPASASRSTAPSAGSGPAR